MKALIPDAAFGAVRARIWEAMARWEASGASGSARPAFEAAWRTAAIAHGIFGDVLARERVWQAWLQAGRPLTRPVQEAIMRDVYDRHRDRRLRIREYLDAIPHAPDREPGEDDDDPRPAWWDR